MLDLAEKMWGGLSLHNNPLLHLGSMFSIKGQTVHNFAQSQIADRFKGALRGASKLLNADSKYWQNDAIETQKYEMDNVRKYLDVYDKEHPGKVDKKAVIDLLEETLAQINAIKRPKKKPTPEQFEQIQKQLDKVMEGKYEKFETFFH